MADETRRLAQVERDIRDLEDRVIALREAMDALLKGNEARARSLLARTW